MAHSAMSNVEEAEIEHLCERFESKCSVRHLKEVKSRTVDEAEIERLCEEFESKCSITERKEGKSLKTLQLKERKSLRP